MKATEIDSNTLRDPVTDAGQEIVKRLLKG